MPNAQSPRLLETAQLAAAPPVGRAGGAGRGAIRAVDAPGFDLFGGGLRGGVVVERARFHFFTCWSITMRTMTSWWRPWPRVIRTRSPSRSDAIRLGAPAVHGDLAAFTRAFGLGPGLEQARDVEPDVQPNRVAHDQIRISIFPLAFNPLTNASVCCSRFCRSRYCSSCGLLRREGRCVAPAFRRL